MASGWLVRSTRDTALTPDHEVKPLARQIFGERLTSGLTGSSRLSMLPG